MPIQFVPQFSSQAIVQTSLPVLTARPRFAALPDQLRFAGRSGKPREYAMIQRLRGEDVKIAWREFGNPDAENVIIAVHGFTRNSHDFDFLAQWLAGRNTRVICPDIVGRGDSGRFQSPLRVTKYELPTYVDQMNKLMPELNLDGKKVTWLGTSMGGAIGMLLAGQSNPPFERLILNDIGARFSRDGFNYLAGLFNAETRTDIDPAIIEPFEWVNRLGFLVTPMHKWMMAETLSATLRNAWRNVNLPTLVLRGAESRVLDEETVAVMQRKPNVTVIEIPGVGHAPGLDNADQADMIDYWLGNN